MHNSYAKGEEGSHVVSAELWGNSNPVLGEETVEHMAESTMTGAGFSSFGPLPLLHPRCFTLGQVTALCHSFLTCTMMAMVTVSKGGSKSSMS